jgi:hypothetical protein
METTDPDRLIEEARERLERDGWSMTEAMLGGGWQVTGDNGKIVYLVQSESRAGAWIGLLAEVAEHYLPPEAPVSPTRKVRVIRR